MALIDPDGFQLFPAVLAGEISPQYVLQGATVKSLAETSARSYLHGARASIISRDYRPTGVDVPWTTVLTIPEDVYRVDWTAGTERSVLEYIARIENAEMTVTAFTFAGAVINSNLHNSGIGLVLDVTSTIDTLGNTEYMIQVELESLDTNTASLYTFMMIEQESAA